MENTTPANNPTTNTDAPIDISELLAAWQNHQDNRARGASIAELMDSRFELDSTRKLVRSNLALAS